MAQHEIVGCVMDGDKDAVSKVIQADIISDGLPDDPRIYFSFDNDDENMLISFPLKEIFKIIEKTIIS